MLIAGKHSAKSLSDDGFFYTRKDFQPKSVYCR